MLYLLRIIWASRASSGQVSILRSCEQQANLLCDDGAEPLVVQRVEVDAIVVA